MNSPLPSILPLPDMLALGWFFLCWVGYAHYADAQGTAVSRGRRM